MENADRIKYKIEMKKVMPIGMKINLTLKFIGGNKNGKEKKEKNKKRE